MAKVTVYGYVTRYPKDNFEMKWETGGFEGDNPEGKYRYAFSNVDEAGRGGWTVPVFTRLDMEFFMSKPNDYKFEPASGRPENMRPQRPSALEYFDKKAVEEQPKIPVVNEMPPVPVEISAQPAPVEEPKKRMGRPPRSSMPKLPELSLP